jgi:DNA processing protein
MSPGTLLTPDGQVIALLCSTLGLASSRELKPLSPREWHELSDALRNSELSRPGDLLGRRPEEIGVALGVSPAMALRLARLLSRGGQLALELEHLTSRGVWVLTRAEDAYPQRLKKLLQTQAPPVLYGAGRQETLEQTALALVGSRDADRNALQFTRELARTCARQHITVVSGAARGVDREAMGAAIEAGGSALGVTVDPLERLIRRPEMRMALTEGSLTLVTPFHPAARWQARNAMRRNRLIYVLSMAAVIASASAGSGGTWAGAIENIEHRWVPTFVREDSSPASHQLRLAGALGLPERIVGDVDVRRLFEANRAPSLLSPDAALDGLPLEHGSSGDHPAQNGEQITQDAFVIVWPLIQTVLKKPRSERDVAEALHLQLGQTRAWLQRAVEEGLVNLNTHRRKLYVLSEHDPHQLEFH